MRARSSIAREVGLAFGLGLVVYGLSLSPNLAEAHDSVRYLNAIDAGESLFHAHHLLFAPLAYAWLALARALGLEGDSVFIVAALDALAGAIGLAAFYAILRVRARVPARFAAAATALPGLSFGYWFYSTSVEVYLIPLALLLLALYAIAGGGPASATGDPDKGMRTAVSRYRRVGLLHAFAVLFHQVHVLFAVPIWAAIWWESRGDLRQVRARVLAHAGTAIPIGLLAYGVAMFGFEGIASANEALRFIAGYAAGDEYWYPLSLGTLARAGVGAARSLIGGHFVFAIPAIGGGVASALEGQGLVDEIFLVRALSPSLGWSLLGLSGLFFLGLLGVAGAAGRALFRARRENDPLVFIAEVSAVAIAPYALFFLFWVPHNVEFWIPQSVFAWLVIALGWWKARPARSSARPLAALAVALCLVNFSGSIDWLRDPTNDYYRALVEPYTREAREADLVMLGRTWILEAYARRFGRAQVTSLERIYRTHGKAGFEAAARAEIGRVTAAGGRVFVSEAAVSPGRDAAWPALPELFAPYRDGWVRVDEKLGSHWIIAPDPSKSPIVEPTVVGQTGPRRSPR